MNRPHHPPAAPVDPDTPLGRALRGGHPTVASLFDDGPLHFALHSDANATEARYPRAEIDVFAVVTTSGAGRITAPPADEAADVLAGPGLTGHQHPETSRAAGEVDQTAARYGILDAIRAAGPEGMTSHELVHAGHAPNTNTAGARLLELRGDRTGYPPEVARILLPTGQLWTRVLPGHRLGSAVHVALEHTDTLPTGWVVAPPKTRPAPDATVHAGPAPDPTETEVLAELIREAWRLIGALHQAAPMATRSRLEERLDRWHRTATAEPRALLVPATDWWF